MTCLAGMLSAQTSRRTIEKYAVEAVKQIALTGRTPTIDILDSLANNAEVSVEMLSRMGEPDDVRQQRACLKLIDDIVDYSLKPTGMKYVDVVRKGLKKAVDRSYEPDVQLHCLGQLALCAKPADAEHIAMYLEADHLRPVATQILMSLPDIDDRLKSIARSDPSLRSRVLAIVDARNKGKKPSDVAAVAPTVAKPKPVAVPLWTESLDREVESLCHAPSSSADSILIRYGARDGVPMLVDLARRKEGDERRAIAARCLMAVQIAADKKLLNGDESYLLLRLADDVCDDGVLRQKLIVLLGETRTIQAFAYLRRYCGKEQYADAMSLATVNLLSAHPEANCGKLVYSMLYVAKQSFIRHYDEQGIDAYIDQVLAAVDNWKADGGYNLAHTEETRMEKRGFWVMHEELGDFRIVFDWLAAGTLTVSLRSQPMLMFSSAGKVSLNGKSYSFHNSPMWQTTMVEVRGGKVSVTVNGQQVVSDAPLSGSDGFISNAGHVKFLADDNGASVRQYFFCRF